MRDVTDNRTGELEVGEVKRGRGRPRKAGAMTNAERQAAYRARRRAERVRPMDRPVYDPGALQDVAELEDDMAELRAQLDATKAELAEAHETIDELQQSLTSELQERGELIKGNQEAFAKIADLRAELAAMKTGAKKSVTDNGNPASFQDMLELLFLFSKARTANERLAICEVEQGVWQRAVVQSSSVSPKQMEQVFHAVMAGKYASNMVSVHSDSTRFRKTVTRKAVTKKGD